MSKDVRRIGFRPDAPSGHHLTSQRGKVSSTSYKWWALESKTIHGAPSTCACCQDTRCSMRKLKVMLGCRSGSVTRRRPTAGNASCVNAAVGCGARTTPFLCLWSGAYVVLLMAFFHPRGTMERHFCQTPSESAAQLAGTRMKNRAACIQIRGDWAEFCERLGFSDVEKFVPPELLLRSAASQLVRCYWSQRLFMSTSFERQRGLPPGM